VSGRLAGKVCVVTGTGGSMGRATALLFAREGAKLVGCDVLVESAEGTVEMVHGMGGEMVSMQPCRLSDPSDCAKLVELAVSEFGRVDVLFNLAAPRLISAGSKTSPTTIGMPRAETKSTWSSTSPAPPGLI
jgi:NAD(P)-dependent dehydrogenase (short-subunit alcohol dehydrogenase family)